MIPGPTTILKAPGCKKLLLLDTLLSGNNMGAEYWTDSFMSAPMLPAKSELQKSPSEGVIFWLDACEKVGSIPFDREPTPEEAEAQRTLEHTTQLSEDDYFQAIENRIWRTKGKERYLRIQCWQVGNHALRRGESVALPQRHLNNMEALLDLLDEDHTEQRLMKAEILRELGWFSEAIKLLQFGFIENIRDAARQILGLCRAQNRMVAKFNPSGVVLEPAIKLRINRAKFAEGLQRVVGAIDRRMTLPFSEHVLIRAEKGELILTTTSFDLSARCHLQAEVANEGSVGLPARFLSRIISGLETVDIDMEIDDFFAVTIKGGSSEFHVEGVSPAKFPHKLELSEPRIMRMEQRALREMLHRTVHAMSQDENRVALNGVMLGLGEGLLTAVATDGRRMAIAEHEMHIPEGLIREYIIPEKLAHQVLGLLKDEGEVEIKFTFDRALFQANATELVGKRVLAGFPKYKDIFPAEKVATVLLKRAEFLKAIQHAALLAKESCDDLPVQLHVSRNSLVITADTKNFGTARESLAIDHEGPELEIRLNSTYLMDGLRTVESDQVSVEFIDGDRPVVLRMGERFVYLIMPMRQPERPSD